MSGRTKRGTFLLSRSSRLVLVLRFNREAGVLRLGTSDYISILRK